MGTCPKCGNPATQRFDEFHQGTDSPIYKGSYYKCWKCKHKEPIKE